MRGTQREAETQAEGEAGSMQGARCETRSRVSRNRPWAEGGAKPLGHRGCPKVMCIKAKGAIFVKQFKSMRLKISKLRDSVLFGICGPFVIWAFRNRSVFLFNGTSDSTS